MRIVLDTNVVVSGLLWRNAPYRLLQRAVDDERIELFSSPVLLAELAEVLGRAHLALRIEEQATSLETLAAGADLLVTGDRTLLAVGSHQGIEIVTPAQALERAAA